MFTPTICGLDEQQEVQGLMCFQWNHFYQLDRSGVFINGEEVVLIPKVDGVFDLSVDTCIWIFCLNL